MHYRNWRKIILSATAIISAAALNGCATPKHTNLLVFGTNTVLGLKVGADATQTPSIQLAYARQELVLMPLLANTSGKGADLTPCPSTAVGQDPPANVPVNCKFIGQEGTNDTDSYSVLASFGAKFDAETTPGGTSKAGGGIAQYFATGLAARTLAEKAGAAAVAGGEAATVASPASAALIVRKGYASQVAMNLLAAVAVTDLNLGQQLTALDNAAETGGRFTRACKQPTTKSACAGVIESYSTPALVGMPESKWQAAVAYQFQ